MGLALHTTRFDAGWPSTRSAKMALLTPTFGSQAKKANSHWRITRRRQNELLPQLQKDSILAAPRWPKAVLSLRYRLPITKGGAPEKVTRHLSGAAKKARTPRTFDSYWASARNGESRCLSAAPPFYQDSPMEATLEKNNFHNHRTAAVFDGLLVDFIHHPRPPGYGRSP